MAKSIFRARAHDARRCNNPACSCRRTRDEDPGQHKVVVQQFTAANHVAEVQGDMLVIYALADKADLGNITNGVDTRGPNAATASQERQGTADAGVKSFMDGLNAKNRAFWARQNGGGR